MAAIAYLRRSRVDTRRPGHVSHEQQMAAVRALAQQHGDDPDELVVLQDWGKSGRRERQHLRGAFAELMRMVEADEVTVIYSYSLSRLGRSIETLGRLMTACEAHNVVIRCHDGFSPDVSTATGRMLMSILGAVHEFSAEWVKERAMEGVRIRLANGDRLGPPHYGEKPGEDVNVVLDAYRAERSLQGAARKLNRDGFPTRSGKLWTASTVTGIVKRNAPGLIPPAPTTQVRASRRFRFSGLLLCSHDSCMLTGRSYRTASTVTVGYRCRRAVHDPFHPRPFEISESKVAKWALTQGLGDDDNDTLRRKLVHIELDGNLLPISAVWRKATAAA